MRTFERINRTKIMFSVVIALAASAADASPANLWIWAGRHGFVSPAGSNCTVVQSAESPIRASIRGEQSPLPNDTLIQLTGEAQEGKRSFNLIAISDSERTNPKAAMAKKLKSIALENVSDLSKLVLEIKSAAKVSKYPAGGTPLVGSILQPSMEGDKFLVVTCGSSQHPRQYQLFDVFTPDKNDPVLEVAVSPNDAASLFGSVQVLDLNEAQKQTAENKNQTPPPRIEKPVAAPAVQPAPTPAEENSTDLIVCTPYRKLPVHGSDLRSNRFNLTNGTLVRHDSAWDSQNKVRKTHGKTYKYLKVEIPSFGKDKSGWVLADYIQERGACDLSTGTAAKKDKAEKQSTAQADQGQDQEDKTGSVTAPEQDENPAPRPGDLESTVLCSDKTDGKLFLRDDQLNVSGAKGLANGSPATRISNEVKTVGQVHYIKVDTDGVQGWISTEFLRDDKSSCPSLNVRYVCTEGGEAILRDDKMKEADKVENSEALELMGTDSKSYKGLKYVQVKYGDAESWIAEKLLVKTTADCKVKHEDKPEAPKGVVACLTTRMFEVPGFYDCSPTGKCWGHKSKYQSRLLCARFAKVGILRCHGSTSYIQCSEAKNCGPGLIHAGFKKLATKDPDHAPLGSAIVYGSRCGNPAGHMEIKSSNKAWISDYIGSKSRNKETRCRPVNAIYYKP